jgi:hypothetical protein
MAASDEYREIVDFLVKPENIESALDLAVLVPRAMDRLHIKFWETQKELVEAGLHKRGAADWIVGFWGDSDAPLEAADFLQKGWSLLQITPGPWKDMPLFWAYWVEQGYRTSSRRQSENELAPVTYGLGFYSQNERLMRRTGATLPSWASTLYDHPARLSGGWKSDKDSLKWGWVVYKEPAKLRARSEVIRLAQGNSLEEEIAGALLKLFDQTRKSVEAENTKLRKSKP